MPYLHVFSLHLSPTSEHSQVAVSQGCDPLLTKLKKKLERERKKTKKPCYVEIKVFSYYNCHSHRFYVSHDIYMIGCGSWTVHLISSHYKRPTVFQDNFMF